MLLPDAVEGALAARLTPRHRPATPVAAPSGLVGKAGSTITAAAAIG